MPMTPLNATHVRIIILSALMTGVAFFDFAIFLYMTNILGQIFFVGESDGWFYYIQVVGLFVSGYLASPLGGLLIGQYGDINGRKPALLISLLGIAVFTLLIVVLPTITHLGFIATLLFIVARLGQSLALGGVIPSAWTFATEHLPIKHLGVGVGCIMAGGILGMLLLPMLISVLENHLTLSQMIQFGWRIPFLLGGVSACVILCFIRNTEETPIFTQIHTPNYQTPTHTISAINLDDPTKQEMSRLLNINIFNKKHSLSLPSLKKHIVGIFCAFTLSWKIASLFVVITILLPSLIDVGFVVPTDYLYVGGMISIFFMMIGSIFYGFMIDRINAGKVMIAGSLFLILQIWLFFEHLKSGGEMILALFALLGFACGVVSTSPVVIVRLFPAKIRLTGVSLSFNTAYALVGAILPFALGYITFHWRLAPALYLMLVVLVAIFISFYVYYLPRTDEDMER